MKREGELRKTAVALGILAALGVSCWGVQPVWAAENKKDAGKDADIQEYDLGELTVEAKRPDWESKLSPGTVTVIRPDDYKGEQKDLPDYLKMVPGVHVREVNGKGQYTTVSVRGSTSAQVGVFVDGVLFNLGGDAAADISTIPVQNVERIEVYRGYVPARFGGTYMGGVINIVTKRPTKSNVQASFGKSSYGGYKGSLQIDAPLGKGALMVGVNREQSDGNFKYTNKYNDYALKEKETRLAQLQAISPETINYYIKVFSTLGSSYLTNDDVMDIVRNPEKQQSLHDAVLAAVKPKYNNSKFERRYAAITNCFDTLRTAQWDVDRLASSYRWRRANDYKNTDVLVKWQDDHWLAKYAWKQIDRHYPYAVGQGSSVDATMALYDLDWTNATLDSDPYGEAMREYTYYHRRQKITDHNLLLGRRDTVGNLEWGWSVNYLKQNKDYHIDNWQNLWNHDTLINLRYPNFWWSTYDSNKLGFKLDGTYKMGDRHLLEFLVDGSKEKMELDGWRMKYNQATGGVTRRWRDHWEQTLFNAQLQDTITLNKKADLWLTPSIRYNRTTNMGRSSAWDYTDKNNEWVGDKSEQTNARTTWQLALKKKVNDNLTLRATAGTYYRLLNLYEIAGDGAGILPMINMATKQGSVFPEPEQGSQWDLSAIWDGKMLGADTAKVQVTYFGRDSKNMLTLTDWNRFYWCYTNAISAKVNGLELQTDLSWKKWDFSLAGTYSKPTDVLEDASKTYAGYNNPTGNNVGPSVMPYLPEWEGYTRLTYRPSAQWSIFGQLHYTGSMNTSKDQVCTFKQSALTTTDLGIKYKPNKHFQLALGVNDLFNKADDMYGQDTTGQVPQAQNVNIAYPIQGRTYYATLQYNF